MNTALRTHLFTLLDNKKTAFILMGGMGVVALIGAFIAQHGFDLQPCILCLYQRWPFRIAAGLALAGYWMRGKHQRATTIMGVLSLTYFANAVIAFYHSGVERHWWKSFLEGCSVTTDMSGDINDLIARINAAPAVPCDSIAWADPIFGLSMANYNVVLCLGMGTLAAIITARWIKAPKAS